ncbi:MAG: hypothetical protein WD226_10905 [Planctomycetota bacterium]
MQRTTLLGALGAAALLASATSAQYTASPITHNFIDIAGSGTATGLSGSDDAGVTIPLGFDFAFYGATISSIGVSTNGYMTTSGTLGDFTPDCPSLGSIAPNGTIAPFHDDMTLVNQGEVFYQTLGVAPNRLTVVQWDNVAGFGSLATASSLTYQVHLFEGSGNIQFHYAGLSDPNAWFPVLGEQAFIGVENSDASDTTEITCNSGSPVLTPNASAYQLDQSLPIISAPDQAISGTLFNIPGLADPGTLYVFAWSLSNGPLGPIPTLENITLDLGLNFKLAGTGLTPANGAIASDTLIAPAGFSGTTVYWQAITIGSFGPLGNISVSNSDSTQLQDGAVFTGSIPGQGFADSYSMPGNAGDLVSIYHCRTDNTGGSGSTLDPYLCLVDPSGVTEAFNDDSAGDCHVTGPYGASQIVDHTLLQTGAYTIYASAYQGIAGNHVGDYELTIVGSGAASTTLLVDDGPICPGQPFLNPASKLLSTQDVKPRR